MFGPRDSEPVPELEIESVRYITEGNQRFLIINLGAGGWIRGKTNRRQAAGLVEDILPDVIIK